MSMETRVSTHQLRGRLATIGAVALLVPILAACTATIQPYNPSAEAYFESTPSAFWEEEAHDHRDHSHGGRTVASASNAAPSIDAGPQGEDNGREVTSARDSEVRVTASEFGFEPSQIGLPANKPVTLALTNGGNLPHDVTIPDLGIQVTAMPGETTRRTVTVEAGGTYEFECSIPGHKEAGMMGSATVMAKSAGEGHGQEHEADGAGSQATRAEHVSHATVASTAKSGNQELKPKLVKGVKVFDLRAEHLKWEVLPGEVIDAYAYNGQVPGPVIRVTEGDKVRVNFTNKLPEETVVHFHGPTLPNAMDGVPDVTQPVVETGGRFTYEFTAKPRGTFVYHTHHNAAVQEPKGLYGMFIVEPKRQAKVADIEMLQVLGESGGYYLINGRAFPATERIRAKVGQRVLIRLVNMGQMAHPMHMHGHPFRIVATDGHPVPKGTELTKDVVNIAPGERYDLLLEIENSGTWMFHCHILSHAANKGVEPGGMITMLKVTK